MARLIGLTGLKGSGKNTAARVLQAAGFEEIKMAGPLKDMLRAFLHYQGVDSVTVERMVDGDLKEEPSEYLGGKTPRYFQQALGTEFGRNLIDPDLWSNAFENRATYLLDLGIDVVCTDVRFPNEISKIEKINGETYRIERDTDINAFSLHESEQHIPTLRVRGIIDNHGDINQLHEEMKVRFCRDVDPDVLAEGLERFTLRYTITMDITEKAEWYDRDEKTGRLPSPLEILGIELKTFANEDNSILSQRLDEGLFSITGRVL